MKTLIVVVMILCAVPAFAQLGEVQPAPQPVPSIFSQIQGLLGRHLAVGALASYDWVAGDWGRPYAVGPAASWVINNNVVLTGSSKYILNTTEPGNRWRSEVQVLVPFYGGERMR